MPLFNVAHIGRHSDKRQGHRERRRVMAGHDYNPFGRQQPRTERSITPLFEFVRGRDGARIACELVHHGPWGVQACFLDCGQLFYSRRFDERWQAVQSAELEKADMEKAGA